MIVKDPNLKYLIVSGERNIGCPIRDGKKDRFFRLRLAFNTGTKVTDLDMYDKVYAIWNNTVYLYDKRWKEFNEYTPTYEERHLLFEELV